MKFNAVMFNELSFVIHLFTYFVIFVLFLLVLWIWEIIRYSLCVYKISFMLNVVMIFK